jgi:hypothetical protein
MALLSPNLPWSLANPRWASLLNPIISVPFLSGLQIDGIQLLASTPKTISTLLGRTPQGWWVVDNTANTAIWRTQPFSTNSLTLEASVNTTISIWVY